MASKRNSRCTTMVAHRTVRNGRGCCGCEPNNTSPEIRTMHLDTHTHQCNHGLFCKRVSFCSAKHKSLSAQQKPFGTQPSGASQLDGASRHSLLPRQSPSGSGTPMTPIIFVGLVEGLAEAPTSRSARVKGRLPAQDADGCLAAQVVIRCCRDSRPARIQTNNNDY